MGLIMTEAKRRQRKTIEEKIAETKVALKALRKAQRLALKKELQSNIKSSVKNRVDVLTKDSEGMRELIAALEAVARTHKLKVPEVIKVVSRIKRTRLKFVEEK